jgi:hypothetical protein
MEHVWAERVVHFTRKQTAAALTACVTVIPACHAVPQPLPEQPLQWPKVRRMSCGFSSDVERTRIIVGTEVCSRKRPCGAAGKVYDRKPDLSDLRAMRTHAGVLVFNVTIGPSGTVADVQLGKPVDAQEPWPTLAERWRVANSGLAL